VIWASLASTQLLPLMLLARTQFSNRPLRGGPLRCVKGKPDREELFPAIC